MIIRAEIGNETVRVRCDLQPTSPVMVDYCTGDGWQPTQWQGANTSCSRRGLIALAREIAGEAVGAAFPDYDDLGPVDWEIEEAKYSIADTNATTSDLDFAAAVEAIAEWYEDFDTWFGGSCDSDYDNDTHEAIREAIDSVDQPEDGGLDDLRTYASAICDAVATACGAESHAGHGRYYVSAADAAGFSLTITEDEE